ncbi:hypothetical protein LINGRAHAP2_LOCUS34362 [Linum grandiflorum]
MRLRFGYFNWVLHWILEIILAHIMQIISINSQLSSTIRIMLIMSNCFYVLSYHIISAMLFAIPILRYPP